MMHNPFGHYSDVEIKNYYHTLYRYIESGVKGHLSTYEVVNLFNINSQFMHTLLCKYILSIQPRQCSKWNEEDDKLECLYRGDLCLFNVDGIYITAKNKCATGLLMADWQYKASNEHKSLKIVLGDLCNYPDRLYHLIRAWQNIHDVNRWNVYGVSTSYMSSLILLYEYGFITDPSKNADNLSNKDTAKIEGNE